MRRVSPGKLSQFLNCVFAKNPVLFTLIALEERDELLEDVLQLSPSRDVEGIHVAVTVDGGSGIGYERSNSHDDEKESVE